MNLVQLLHEEIVRTMPDIRSELDRPLREDGTWMLTLTSEKACAIIEWTPGRPGFGFSSIPFWIRQMTSNTDYPDEHFETAAALMSRIRLELL